MGKPYENTNRQTRHKKRWPADVRGEVTTGLKPAVGTVQTQQSNKMKDDDAVPKCPKTPNTWWRDVALRYVKKSMHFIL